MIDLIPAWYQNDTWMENEQSWYVRRMHSECDDTVKQIQLFHRSGAYPYRILLLSFAPNLRHFLHRQSVYQAPYWSCFDAIQKISRKKARPFSVHRLKWPDGIEFIYTPFALVALLDGEKYAQAEYGEDGNLIAVDLFSGGARVRRNLYDDRGFLSATIVYEQGEPKLMDYLTEKGRRKLRVFSADGHVEINAAEPTFLLDDGNTKREVAFQKLHYKNIDEVIQEVLTAFLAGTDRADIFCVAAHARHMELLTSALSGRRVVLSFFAQRGFVSSELLHTAAWLVADSAEMKEELLKKSENGARIIEIAPFDTRADVGISQQLPVQMILLPVDGLDESLFAQTIAALGAYLQQNEKARVCLFTRRADYDRKSALLHQTAKILRSLGLPEAWALPETDETEENAQVEEEIPVRFTVEQCVEELAVSRCVRMQRVIVELRDTPELYLQILAVSLGIPQIVRTENAFVKDGGNGRVISGCSELPDALAFYLSSLSNWNRAQIYAHELGKQYTTDALLAKWKEVITSFA